MRFLFLSVILFCFCFALDGEWHSDYNTALSVAKKENKNIYILITSESCRWCRRFERKTLQDEAVLEELQQDYVLLHLDRDKDYRPDFIKVTRVPKHYFITKNTKEIYSFLGYWDELDFRSFLVDVKNEYKNKIKLGKIK